MNRPLFLALAVFPVITFSFVATSLAALPPGYLDTDFGTNGQVTIQSFESVDGVVLDNGKILVAGNVLLDGNNEAFAVVRYNANGTLDTAFGTNGIAIADFTQGNGGLAYGGTDRCGAIKVQPSDGKIILAGFSNRGGGQNEQDINFDFALARFSSEGIPDGSFGAEGAGGKITNPMSTGGIMQDVISGLAVQGDGKIIAVGSSQPSGGSKSVSLARYNINGSLDNSFNNSGTLLTSQNGGAVDVAVQTINSELKIVLAGEAAAQLLLMRFNEGGTNDTSFDGDGVAIAPTLGTSANSVLALPNGQILAGGRTSGDFLLMRFNFDGGIDTNFGTNGSAIANFGGTDIGSAIALQANGKIVQVGKSGGATQAIARFNTNGLIDLCFGVNGKNTVNQSRNTSFFSGPIVGFQPDGKIIVAGDVIISRFLGGEDCIPLLVAAGTTLTNESCINGGIDPGETVTMSLAFRNDGLSFSGNLVATLQTNANVMSPSSPQNYGPIATGATVARDFTFTAAGNCGDQITLTLQLQGGTTNFGTVVYTLSLGVMTVVSTENFDAVTVPALPIGWTTTASGAEIPWVTSTNNPASAPNGAFAPDVSAVGLTELISASLAVPAGGAQLTFKNLYNMEDGYDGMVLEISVNGGVYQDIIGAGGNFLSGGYKSALKAGNPLMVRQAWTGLSAGTTAAPAYIPTIINLPIAASGQNARFKWRVACDSSSVAPGSNGVRIDDIVLRSTTLVCCTGPLLKIMRSGANVVLSWSSSADFQLQSSLLLTSGWLTQTNGISDNGTTKTLLLNPQGTNALFFRLKNN